MRADVETPIVSLDDREVTLAFGRHFFRDHVRGRVDPFAGFASAGRRRQGKQHEQRTVVKLHNEIPDFVCELQRGSPLTRGITASLSPTAGWP